MSVISESNAAWVLRIFVENRKHGELTILSTTENDFLFMVCLHEVYPLRGNLDVLQSIKVGVLDESDGTWRSFFICTSDEGTRVVMPF